jgi:mannose-6-phosphate isomerase-like protein (cupin superfamily)
VNVPAHVLQVALSEPQAKRPPPGNLAVPVLRCGDLEVELYAPVGSDPQKPHTRDEIYVIASGSGYFHCGEQRQSFKVGTLLFVPAGINHHFADFSPDFSAWVMFFGPEGGIAKMTVD